MSKRRVKKKLRKSLHRAQRIYEAVCRPRIASWVLLLGAPFAIAHLGSSDGVPLRTPIGHRMTTPFADHSSIDWDANTFGLIRDGGTRRYLFLQDGQVSARAAVADKTESVRIPIDTR